MRGLDLDLDTEEISGDAFALLVSNLPPDGVLFPNLEWLHWGVDRGGFPFAFRLFLSSHLQRVTLYDDPNLDPTLRLRTKALVQMVSVLPASLEQLSVLCGGRKSKRLGEAMSSLVCRCGSSLRRFATRVPLSEEAVLHLIQLPNLSYLRTYHEPPQVVPMNTFPSLEHLRLASQDALPWLHLFASHDRAITLSDPGPPPNARDRLKSLEFPKYTVVDSKLLCSIVTFRNLAMLRIHTDDCTGGDPDCIFRLTNDDIQNLVIALPRLKILRLGKPCPSNTCNTTIDSLVSISVKCLSLTALEIHFNTRELVSDVLRLLDGGVAHDKAKCKLRALSVGSLPLEALEEDSETIAMGFKAIFPCLKSLREGNARWRKVQSKLRGLQ